MSVPSHNVTLTTFCFYWPSTFYVPEAPCIAPFLLRSSLWVLLSYPSVSIMSFLSCQGLYISSIPVSSTCHGLYEYLIFFPFHVNWSVSPTTSLQGILGYLILSPLEIMRLLRTIPPSAVSLLKQVPGILFPVTTHVIAGLPLLFVYLHSLLPLCILLVPSPTLFLRCLSWRKIFQDAKYLTIGKKAWMVGVY